MDSQKIYRRLTENIQNKMSKYKEGKSTKSRLNDQLTINICSLCRFLQKREEEKVKENILREKIRQQKEQHHLELSKVHKAMIEQEKKERNAEKKSDKMLLKKKTKVKGKPKLSEEMQKLKNEKNEIENKIKELDEQESNLLNETILDAFIPPSRLTKTLQMKLEALNNPIIEEDEKEGDMSLEDDQLNLENSLDQEKIANLIADEDTSNERFNAEGDPFMNGPNLDFLNNDLSISMSLYNKPVGFDDFAKNDVNLQKKISSEKESLKSISSKNSSSLEYQEEKKKRKLEVNKEEELRLANEEFKNILKPKVIKEIINDMCYDYLKYMYNIFIKMKQKSNEEENESNNQSKSLNFINQFKSFVLDIGISDKIFYEQCIREIIYNKNELEFNEFLECFKKLINLKFDQTFLKFKFLFHITEREDDEYFKKEELENYFNLLEKCKKLYDSDIQDEIRLKLIPKYKKIFPDNSDKLYTRKLSLVLEQFFDLK